MYKSGGDKVNKPLLRNCEHTSRPTTRSRRPIVVREVVASSSEETVSSQKENELNQPTLCSSEALANYISDLKKSVPLPISAGDINAERNQISTQLTKKLNFHFNDKIYRNLVELNTTFEDFKTSKIKRTGLSVPKKKDLEPEIEDFCQDMKETDTPPKILITQPKFKPIIKVEDGGLHKLVALFDVL